MCEKEAVCKYEEAGDVGRDANLEQEALVEVATREQGVLLQGCQVLGQLCAHRHQLPQLFRCLLQGAPI